MILLFFPKWYYFPINCLQFHCRKEHSYKQWEPLHPLTARNTISKFSHKLASRSPCKVYRMDKMRHFPALSPDATITHARINLYMSSVPWVILFKKVLQLTLPRISPVYRHSKRYNQAYYTITAGVDHLQRCRLPWHTYSPNWPLPNVYADANHADCSAWHPVVLLLVHRHFSYRFFIFDKD